MRFLKFGWCVFMAALVCLTICQTGCTPPTDPTLDLMDTDLKKTKVDDLTRTMGFVFSDRRFEQREFESKISSGLNRWATYTMNADDHSWQLDPKVKELIGKFDSVAALDRFDETSFVGLDAYFLQEAAWVNESITRVTESPQLNAFELYRLAADDYRATSETLDPIDEIVKRLQPDLDDDSINRLSDSLKFFDWVVRNVQLVDSQNAEDREVDEIRLNDSESLAAAGVAGTGYKHQPWQTLMFGRGDYVERAKLMMLGLQQLGVDSIMLSVRSGDKEMPWVVGVAINDDYYLFDTKLGLPIFGKKTGSIATLAEVRANPELLTSLDLTVEESLEDDTKYWVKPDQLDDLKGYVYFTPESQTRRMMLLEENLIGEDRLPLLFNPSEALKKLPKADGLEVELWDISIKTRQFRQAVREALEQKQNNVLADRLNWYYQEESYVHGFTRYRTSRARFFDGKFESPRNALRYNAIESFERLKYTDKTIELLATDPNLQRQLGILKAGQTQDAKSFNNEIRSVQAQMRLVKRDTGLFLAQSHFDNGSAKAAANWLSLLEVEEGTERWRDGIMYLLARSMESNKEYEAAISVYGEDKTLMQAHGNLIRARLINQLIEKYRGDS